MLDGISVMENMYSRCCISIFSAISRVQCNTAHSGIQGKPYRLYVSSFQGEMCEYPTLLWWWLRG